MSQAKVELAAVERKPAKWDPSGVGLLHLHDETLTGHAWMPSTALQSLLTLLCTDRRIYVCLDSEKLRYRRAPIHHVYWYTEGHPEVEELLTELGSSLKRGNVRTTDRSAP